MGRGTILLVAGFSLIVASQASAAVKTEMFLDAGGGVTATIDIDNNGIASCSGSCGGLTESYDLTGVSAHGSLTVRGTIGAFTVVSTGIGGLDSLGLGRMDLNSVNATSSQNGTLLVEFTDTDYGLAGGGGKFGNQFFLTASTNSVTSPNSKVNFGGFVSGGNTIPAGTVIGTFLGLSNSAAGPSGFANLALSPQGSLTSVTQIVFNNNVVSGVVQQGTVNTGFDIATNTAAVPEPASITLFGAVVSIAMLKLRRKFSA